MGDSGHRDVKTTVKTEGGGTYPFLVLGLIHGIGCAVCGTGLGFGYTAYRLDLQ